MDMLLNVLNEITKDYLSEPQISYDQVQVIDKRAPYIRPATQARIQFQAPAQNSAKEIGRPLLS